MALQEHVIEKILRKDEYTRPIFLGAFARNELPKLRYPCCFILNTDPRTKPGAHWIAFYYTRDRFCYFFDSYGNSPAKFRLKSFIEKTSNKWTFNDIQIQGYSEFCGYYCLLYLLYLSRDNEAGFFKNLTSSQIQNDVIIKNLIQKYS